MDPISLARRINDFDVVPGPIAAQRLRPTATMPCESAGFPAREVMSFAVIAGQSGEVEDITRRRPARPPRELVRRPAAARVDVHALHHLDAAEPAGWTSSASSVATTSSALRDIRHMSRRPAA